MKGKWFSVVLVLALVGVAFMALPALRVHAAGTILYYPVDLAKGATFSGTTMTAGTPFAVYGQITGAPAGATCTGPKVRLMSASSSGTADSSFRTWAGAGGWLTDSGAWASFPGITTDASGNWSGWGFAAVPATAANTWLELRINCGGTNYSSTRVSVALMDMAASGGWLEETVGSARAGQAVVVKDDMLIVGMYAAEDNGVAEGYSYTGAGYKVAVPACIACGYRVETWDLAAPGVAVGQVNTMGAGQCPDNISAGAVTSLDACNLPTTVTLRALGALPLASASLSAIPIAGLVFLGAAALYRRRRD